MDPHLDLLLPRQTLHDDPVKLVRDLFTYHFTRTSSIYSTRPFTYFFYCHGRTLCVVTVQNTTSCWTNLVAHYRAAYKQQTIHRH